MSRLLTEVRNPDRWLAPAAWLACVAVCPPLLLLFTPGITLVPRRNEGEADPRVRAVEVIGASLCFWIATFWFLRWIPISLEVAFHACAGISVAFQALRPRRQPAPTFRALLSQIPYGALLAVAAILWLRLLPMNSGPVPAGADMSMHVYLTELIVRAGGVPSSYLPILPIESFGTFPVGFQTIAALVSRTSELATYQAAFWVACLSHGLLSLSLFALIRPHASAGVAGAVAFAVPFIGHAPQSYINWGGNPTVLAIAFAALLFASLLRVRSWRLADAALAGLLLSGLALTHTIVLVQAFYLMGLPLLGALAWQGPRSGQTVRSLTVFAASFAAISAPYLWSVDPGVLDSETLAWIQNWVRNTDHAWSGDAASALFSIPSYAIRTLGDRTAVFVPLVVLGLGVLRGRDPMSFGLHVAFLAVAFLLILNTHFWILPLSPLVYPERVAAMLVLPLCILSAVGLEALLRSWGAGWRGLGVTWALVLTLAWAPFGLSYLEASSEALSVFPSDLRAFAWLDEHAAPDDVIVTQYGDAGIWIPGILFRPVTKAHINVAHLHDIEMPASGRFLYSGSRCVYPCSWSHESPPDPALWREVHADRKVRIYERRSDLSPVTRHR